MSTITAKNPDIARQINSLIQNDPVFGQHFSDYEQVDRMTGDDGMDGLIHIVLGQQVSTAAADAMRLKFIDRFGLDNPKDIVKADDDILRSCGLSRQKIGYVRGLAQAVIDGEIDFARWHDASTDQIILEITTLKGFGLWSAQMYLIFNLCRPDVWPHGDLGIQKGLQYYLGLDDKPSEKETLNYQVNFTGYETAASLLLWRIKDNL